MKRIISKKLTFASATVVGIIICIIVMSGCSCRNVQSAATPQSADLQPLASCQHSSDDCIVNGGCQLSSVDSAARQHKGTPAAADSTKRKVSAKPNFCCLGEGRDRPENFDRCPVTVTEENIRHLYRKYEVKKLEGTDLYLVRSDRIYTTSRYLNRLIKLENGKQVAARTFYGWDVVAAFRQGDKYMIGLNSLMTTAGYKNHSTFACKTVLLDSNLNTIKERVFRNKADWYEYVGIESLKKVKNGYDFVVVNVGFDQDDYYEFRGHLSNENVVTSSSKAKKQRPRQPAGDAD